MHKGMPHTDGNIKGDTPQTSKIHLGKPQTSNLRLKPSSSTDKRPAVVTKGSGDFNEETSPNLAKSRSGHPLYKVGIDPHPSLQNLPQDYAESKVILSLPSEARLKIEKKLEYFLNPLKQNTSSSSSSLSVRAFKPEAPTNRLTSPSIDSSGDGECFPFKVTPSGNLKVASDQVVFQSKKLSVLVANPDRTRINVYSDESISDHSPVVVKKQEGQRTKMAFGSGEFSRNSAMDAILSQAGISGLGSIIGETPVRTVNQISSEYESKETSQILEPELSLSRLGYTGQEPIDWTKVSLPDKKDLFTELSERVAKRKNADCKVHIGDQEFSCHLIVLQCYSDLFDGYVAIKKVEIPSDKCSSNSFKFIYEWMVSEEQSYKNLSRDNVLDIFNSAKYLRIKDLVEQCWAFVDNIEVFNEDTAFLLYVDAKAKNVPEVQELMIPRIQEFFFILVSSQDWLDLDVQDVKNLLTSNYIKVNLEMEVFMSAVRWLKHDWNNRDQYKYEVLCCVRFGNITPWQLVDIKRNPENPEFMELAQDPSVCKLIDDGLAFMIIKYWYGQEHDDFQHWNSVLGLQEPPPRNWSSVEKTYFTYREFLIYLDQYRRNQLIEKSKPKATDKKASASTGAAQSIDESGKKEKSDGAAAELEYVDEGSGIRHDEASMKAILAKHSTEIEEVFKTSGEKPHRKSEVQDKEKDQDKEEKDESKDKGKDEVRIGLIAKLREGLGKKKEEKIKEEKFKDEKIKPVEEPGTTFRIENLFTDTENEFAKDHMNRLSYSALGAKNKDYVTEASLFHTFRETVLVFGGVDPYNVYGVAKNGGKDIYRYMPYANVWEFVGEMPEPRHYHAAQFLKGRVYLAGGTDPRFDDVRGQNVVVDTVWSYEPVKRSWFSEGSLKNNRKNFGLIALHDCLYAIGGKSRTDDVLESVEYFEIRRGTWLPRASMHQGRVGLGCTRYRDLIWVAGGLSQQNVILDTVEVYDSTTNQWTDIVKLSYPRCYCHLIVMNDRLYAIGGAARSFQKENKAPTSINCIDVWHRKELSWTTIMELAIPRHGHAVAYLGTQILIIGGVTTIYMRALANTECLCTKRGTWIRGVALLPVPVSGHAAVTLPPAMILTSDDD